MSDDVSRRGFGMALGAVAGVTAVAGAAEQPKQSTGPAEAEYTRDYDPPKFVPGWKKPQLNRTLLHDFVIFAHDDLDMVKKLLEKYPGVLNAAVDWGGGDWETALGGASHMGRRDIAEYLIEAGARVDLFASTMLGELVVVKALLTLQPKLIDAKGPHGFGLHWHAHVGNEKAKDVLDYLQGLKKVDTSKFPKFGK
jgi:hypothetical protein